MAFFSFLVKFCNLIEMPHSLWFNFKSELRWKSIKQNNTYERYSKKLTQEKLGKRSEASFWKINITLLNLMNLY